MAQETELEMTQRDVREGAGHVARQKELLVQVTEKGRNTKENRELLLILEESQAAHEKHLAHLLKA
jgi:hypothetical protein